MKTMVFVCVALLGLAGCAHTGAHKTPTMSDAKFLELPLEEQKAYLEGVTTEHVVLRSKKEVEYAAERKVEYGTSDDGFSMQWSRKLGFVMFYPGHTTGPLGMEMAGILVLKADKDGNIEYQESNGVVRPTTLMASYANQEGFGRFITKVGAQPVSSFLNGGYAADKYTGAACKGSNCGGAGSVIVNQVEAVAGSAANAAVDAAVNAALGSCPGCEAPVAPKP